MKLSFEWDEEKGKRPSLKTRVCQGSARTSPRDRSACRALQGRVIGAAEDQEKHSLVCRITPVLRESIIHLTQHGRRDGARSGIAGEPC